MPSPELLELRVETLLQKRPIPVDAICTALCALAQIADPRSLDLLCKLASLGDVFDEYLAHPALALMPAWGEAGLHELKAQVVRGKHHRPALMVLLSVATGQTPSKQDLLWLPETWPQICTYGIANATNEAAVRLVREIMLDQATNENLRASVFWAFATQLMVSPPSPQLNAKLEFFLTCFADTRLMLNQSTLDTFSELLESAPEKEEELHRFLFQHPVLLDPLATEIRSKHQLGAEFITDFVVRRINDAYVLVEIENSTDRLFTKKGTFTSSLSEAIGQVRDFQGWISDNIAYAQARLPGIRHPEALVVIGRRKEFDPELARKLDEENFGRRRHIAVVTYDDLLGQATTVYRNMLERPISFKGKALIADSGQDAKSSDPD